MVAVGRRHLDDVAEVVLGPRIGLVDLLRPALGVVGQHDEHLAGGRVRLHVLGPVHRRRLEQVGGQPRIDHDVGLRVEAVGGRERPLAEHERQPRHRAVLVVAGDRQRAFRQQPHVVRPCRRSLMRSLETKR